MVTFLAFFWCCKLNERYVAHLAKAAKIVIEYFNLHNLSTFQNGRIIPPAPDKSVVGMTKVKMSKGVVTQDANGGSESAGQPEEAVQDEVFPNLIVDPKCPVSHPEVLLIPFKLLKECEQTLTNRSLALTFSR